MEPTEEASLDEQCSEEYPPGCDRAAWDFFVLETTKIEDDASEEINCEEAALDVDVAETSIDFDVKCEEEASGKEVKCNEAASDMEVLPDNDLQLFLC